MITQTKKVFTIYKYSVLFLLGIFILFPIYYMMNLSFRSQSSLYSRVTLLPVDLNLNNYRLAFENEFFIKSLINTLIVCFSSTLIALLFSLMAAYSLTILKYKGRDTLGRIIVIAFLTPGAILFIPMAVIAANIHLSNTLRGLILVYLSFLVPLGTYLLIGFFKSIPLELEEAARIDGANRLQALFFIILPLVAPGLISVAIITFTGAYNELLYSLVINTNPDVRTLPVTIVWLTNSEESPWGLMMACSAMAALPVMLLYFAGQRFVVEGLQTGSVKG
ncbi:MAG: carbohydrate ABC transporter permease [Actinobacteria bacterium]|nr:carbohydrate ABC transporter permease [Actinomycetota bacterium]